MRIPITELGNSLNSNGLHVAKMLNEYDEMKFKDAEGGLTYSRGMFIFSDSSVLLGEHYKTLREFMAKHNYGCSSVSSMENGLVFRYKKNYLENMHNVEKNEHADFEYMLRFHCAEIEFKVEEEWEDRLRIIFPKKVINGYDLNVIEQVSSLYNYEIYAFLCNIDELKVILNSLEEEAGA